MAAQHIKEIAYALDPICWLSYSGEQRDFKRSMERRRIKSLSDAERIFQVGLMELVAEQERSHVDQPDKPAVDFALGDEVEKIGGDYTFRGPVVGIIVKKSKQVRYAVEDDRGVLHIFSGKQLRKVDV